ncbi:hypothetical protein Hanom_Chr09g00837631 [Helianthus anomalus]
MMTETTDDVVRTLIQGNCVFSTFVLLVLWVKGAHANIVRVFLYHNIMLSFWIVKHCSIIK